MKTYYFAEIEEIVFQECLANGLQLYIVPKPNHHTVHGVLSVACGSVHRHLRHRHDGRLVQLPAGVAHFLEHKMFEGANGVDAFQLFAEQGAMANAFTSYTQTNYVFSAPINIEQNILTLLDVVQQSHFTPSGVAKEKGIIQQELLMYEDDPYAKGYQILLGNLYPNHPVGEDILGTPEAIEAMTFADLQICFRECYRPDNMRLIIVGNVDATAIVEMIQAHQQARELLPTEFTIVPPLTAEFPIINEARLYLDVSQPVVMLGIRCCPLGTESNVLRSYLILDVLAEMLLGPTSKNYHKWYQAQLLDASFALNTAADTLMHHVTLEAATDSPDELLDSWQEVFATWRQQPDLNAEHFAAVVRGRIGDLLRELDNLEGVAAEFAECLQYGYTPFEVLNDLQQLTYSDITAYAEQYLTQVALSWVTILPLNEQKV
ncbi:insulinase family protein [Aerococcaceae bacterium NML160702]|nr:insulinase family protein [Aerococcaceae bacterium NML160702]